MSQFFNGTRIKRSSKLVSLGSCYKTTKPWNLEFCLSLRQDIISFASNFLTTATFKVAYNKHFKNFTINSLSEPNYHTKWQQIARNATLFFILNTIHQSTEKRHQSNFVSNSIKVWFEFLIYAWREFTILRNWQVPKSWLLIIWMVIIRNKQSFYKIVSEEKLMDEKIISFQRNLGIYSLQKWDSFRL